MFNLFNY